MFTIWHGTFDECLMMGFADTSVGKEERKVRIGSLWFYERGEDTRIV